MTFAERIAYERTFGFAERWYRAKERLAMFVAWHVLPHEVRKWVVIRAHADASSGQYGHLHPDDVTAFQLTERMA